MHDRKHNILQEPPNNDDASVEFDCRDAPEILLNFVSYVLDVIAIVVVCGWVQFR